MVSSLVQPAARGTLPAAIGRAVVPRAVRAQDRRRSDVRLLTLRASLRRAEAEAVFLSDLAEEAAPTAARTDLERSAELAWAFAAELRERILRVPAEGPAGLAVKLELAADGIGPDAVAADERAVLAALADARRLAGQ
jgi:hypothetical protein